MCDFKVGDLLMVTGSADPSYNGLLVECTEVKLDTTISCSCRNCTGETIGIMTTRIHALPPHSHMCWKTFTKIEPLSDEEVNIATREVLLA